MEKLGKGEREMRREWWEVMEVIFGGGGEMIW